MCTFFYPIVLKRKISTDLNTEILLLRVSNLLHLSSELSLLYGEASKLADDGPGFESDIITEHAPKQIQR